MAFHLGCLRTLDQLGLLQQARVLSTVSGGSVIGGIYAAHAGGFPTFEEKVRATLRRGFLIPALETAIKTPEGLKALLSFGMLAVIWIGLIPIRFLAAVMSRFNRSHTAVPEEKWVPRRFASRTTILRRTFDRLLFQGVALGDLARDRPRLIVNAAELRTGSAFYFGQDGAGSWRVGKMQSSGIPLAHAVAASAAYPLALPALDEDIVVTKRDGSLARARVTLTDGGVYDNLGLSPLWPDRDPEISVAVEPVDTIVACRAGYGLRTGNPTLFVGSRMSAVFATIHGRAQNATMKRLFDLKEAKRLRTFVLPYLDQQDSRLAFPPPNLVTREAVANYPTDFSAMPDEWIERLSKRGEQLTLAVIREHAPELLPPGWQPAPPP